MKRTFVRLSQSFSRQPSAAAQLVQVQKWNKILAILFALQGLAVLVLSSAHQLPLQLTYLVKDTLASAVTGETVWAPAVRTLGHVNLAWVVALLLFMAALLHLVMATDLLRRRQWYEQSLKRGVAPLRWWAYGLTGGLMAVAVALASGMYVLTSLLLLAALVMAAASWGLRAERPQSSRLAWVAHIVTVAVAWLVVASYGLNAFVFGDGRLDGYAYAAVAVMLVWLAAVAAITGLRRSKTSRFSNGLFAEYIYQLLTLVAVSAVTWIVFAGALWA